MGRGLSKMASRAAIQQITTFAIIEGTFAIVWEKKYQPGTRNKTFKALYDSLIEATTAAIRQVAADCGGMSAKEYDKAAAKIERLRLEAFDGRSVDIMEIISMCIDLLNSILIKIKPGTPRHTATMRVWRKIRAMEHYFDGRKRYDDPAGLISADTYRRIMNE